MIFASQSTAGGGLSMIVMMVVLVALMYFMMIRPQRKEQKKMEEMLSNLEVGDAVVTSSGFYGVIIDISDEDVIVEFGNNKNCRIPMRKAAISQVEKPEQAVRMAEQEKAEAEKPAEKKKGLFSKKEDKKQD
ncbi:MAG: preprotein translocase subunit YajC [Eubacterium sp.]|nr:preprotein translocase subunit YajC [Eubacterium sp.]